MKIRLVKPYVGDDELKNLEGVMQRAWLGRGPLCKEFEDKWNEFLGVKASTAVNSGTAALHLALKAYNFPAGKKVLVPAMTFCSTANAPIYCGLEPVFVDVDEETLSIDIEDMKRKYDKDCVAVIPVHFGGHPAKMEEIVPWAHEQGLKVISDCAHVVGGMYKGKRLGTWADISCFSFQEKKILVTGDGGMISSNDPELIESLRSIKEVGMSKDTFLRFQQQERGESIGDPLHWAYDVKALGYKYNMCDVIAAIGLAQLRKVDYIVKNRIDTLNKLLKGIEGLNHIKPAMPYDMTLAYYDFMVRLSSREVRDQFIVYLQTHNIATGVHTMPVPHFSYYRQFKADTPVADRIWEQYVILPFYVDMTDEEIEYVIKHVKEFDDALKPVSKKR
ncbi:DegT/DnrJ/EryC1/StrS family aminotransferase [Candidatus Woesearchaeota archaeon]|nr:DegT/DnrJ/EryC1/StrS family aminotransferase [Candidatus Woesearchaeota archaeon]